MVGANFPKNDQPKAQIEGTGNFVPRMTGVSSRGQFPRRELPRTRQGDEVKIILFSELRIWPEFYRVRQEHLRTAGAVGAAATGARAARPACQLKNPTTR